MPKWRLKWWQSALLGALIGLGAYYCQYNVPREHAPSCSRQAFFGEWLSRRAGGPDPFKDVVITPQLDGVYTVTGQHFSREARAFQKILLEIPPDIDAGAGFMTLMQEYAGRYFWIRYEYQWWLEPRLLIWAYPAIGALVLGGVIPFLTYLWLGAPPADSEKRYDIDRFSKNSEDPASSPVVPTNAESEQLDAAISAVQQVSAGAPVSNAISSAAPQPVPARKLDNKPLVEASPTVAETKKDFGGEFYPTEIHHDESKGDSDKSS